MSKIMNSIAFEFSACLRKNEFFFKQDLTKYAMGTLVVYHLVTY